MSSNRIGGDFNSDAVEAFRAAYAAQYLTPQELEVDQRTGLPTDTISNTSPWIETTGLWKYPSGKGIEEDLRAPFNPDAYYTSEEEDDDEQEIINLDEMTPEELDAFLQTLDEDELLQLSQQYEQLSEYESDEDDTEEDLSDEEVETLINELLGEEEE